MTSFLGLTLAGLLVPTPASATVIDFDDLDSECVWDFIDGPLSDEYAHLGVTFSGSGPNDGGGLIDECGLFGTVGHSSPNFLGFNVNDDYAGGGVPTPPQTLEFDPPVQSVSMVSGSAQPGSVTVEAFDAAGLLLDSDAIMLAPRVQYLSVTGTDITKVVIDSDANYFIIDDIAIDQPVVVDPMLTISGTCPGDVSLDFSQFSPTGTIAILKGSGPGSDALAAGPCAGIVTGLAGTSRQNTMAADSFGDGVGDITVGSAACGKWLQALDVSTCTLSDPVAIP